MTLLENGFSYNSVQLHVCCVTNRKVAGSIPAGVTGFFIHIILPIALWPWVRLSL